MGCHRVMGSSQTQPSPTLSFFPRAQNIQNNTSSTAPQSKSNGLARCLNRLSLLISAVATLSLLHLYLHSSAAAAAEAAGPHHSILSLVPFPSSSCDASLSSRDLLTPDKRFKSLAASFAFNRRSASFGSLFGALRSLRLLSNSSRVLSVSAGAGHGDDAHALIRSSVADVTAIDHVWFPLLVKWADPHNLPFFDGVFNLGFSAGLDAALFPRRFVEEMERTMRKGVTVVVAVAVAGERAESDEELDGIKALFRRSSMVEVRNVTLVGDQMRLIVMRNNGNSP